MKHNETTEQNNNNRCESQLAGVKPVGYLQVQTMAQSIYFFGEVSVQLFKMVIS